MDGSSKNTVVDGVLFRPVSLSVALSEFPVLIYEMVCRKTRIFPLSSANGLYGVKIFGMNNKMWTLRTEDYTKCLNITRKINSPDIFPSSFETTLDIIKSFIAVEFAGRV